MLSLVQDVKFPYVALHQVRLYNLIKKYHVCSQRTLSIPNDCFRLFIGNSTLNKHF